MRGGRSRVESLRGRMSCSSLRSGSSALMTRCAGGRRRRLGKERRAGATHMRWLLLVVLGLACGDAQDECSLAAPCDGEVRVATWWREGALEPGAFKPLRDALREKTGLEIEHISYSKKSEYLEEIDAALKESSSSTAVPDAMLLNNGDDVLSRAGCGADGGEGQLEPLEHEFARGWFAERYLSDLMATVSCRGHVYGLPIGMHRLNHLVYNRALFQAAGIVDPEQKLIDLRALLEAARDIQGVLAAEASVFVVPLKAPDALSRFFVENVMLAELGVEEYLAYWRGFPDREALFARGLERVQELSRYFSHDVETEAVALSRVIAGQAAMYVTGDWVLAEVLPELDAGDIGSMPFPGTQDAWVYTGDVFAVPLRGNENKGFAWGHSIAEASVQEEFAAEKLAVPARRDVDVPEGMSDPRDRLRWVRALSAIGPGALWDIGGELVKWAATSYPDDASLLHIAGQHYRETVANCGPALLTVEARPR